MKVSGTGAGSSATGGSRRVSKSDGGGAFRQVLAGAMDAPAPVQQAEQASALAGVDALLMVQAVDGPLERDARRRLVRRGEELLDKLEEIRRGLLLGTVPASALADLATMVRARREACQDPRLAALLDEIELRAEVEIAKLSRRS